MKLALDNTKKYGLAVSGGVDSMVLMHLAKTAGLQAVVLTVDHSLRAESAEDAFFVAERARELGFGTITEKVDVDAFAKQNKLSTELAARQLRYAFFERAAEKHSLDYILLAHHLDDQAETVLMRILRGTGIFGLKGIADRGEYLHPLIGYSKSEIAAYAAEHGIDYREDATNKDSCYRRNFLRNEVFPLIEKEYPDYRNSFLRLANAAAETESFVIKSYGGFEKTTNGVAFCTELFSKDSIVLKGTIRDGLRAIGVMQDVEDKTFRTLLSLNGKPSSTAVDLGQGLTARVEYDEIIIERAPEKKEFCKAFCPDESYVFCGCEYTFEKGDEIKKGMSFVLSKVPQDAVVRSRKEGDRFCRCNGKSKSLSDFLTDNKVKKEDRDSLLYLASGSEILAILGWEISDKVKVTEQNSSLIWVNKRLL